MVAFMQKDISIRAQKASIAVNDRVSRNHLQASYTPAGHPVCENAVGKNRLGHGLGIAYRTEQCSSIYQATYRPKNQNKLAISLLAFCCNISPKTRTTLSVSIV